MNYLSELFLKACTIISFLLILCGFHGGGTPQVATEYTSIHYRDKHVIKTDNISFCRTHYLEVPKFFNDILLSTHGVSAEERSLLVCYHLFLIWQKSTTCDPKVFFRVLTLVLEFHPNQWYQLFKINDLQEEAVETEKNVREEWYRTEELDDRYSNFDVTKLSKICSNDCFEEVIRAMRTLFDEQKNITAYRVTPDLTFESGMSSLKTFLAALIGSEKDLEEFRYFAHPLIVFALINYHNMNGIINTPEGTYVETTVDIYYLFVKLNEAVNRNAGGIFSPPKETPKEKKTREKGCIHLMFK